MKTKLIISGLIVLSFPTALFAAVNQVPPMNQVPNAPPTNQAPRPVVRPTPIAPVAAQEPAPLQAEPAAVSATSSDAGAPSEPIGVDQGEHGSSTAMLLMFGLLFIFLAALGAWIRKLLEGLKKGAGTKAEEKKGGDTKPEEKKPCERCGGKGTITETHTKTVKCTHCKGSGNDPCHNCGGTGKMSLPNPANSEEELESFPPCDFCGGSGKHRVGAGRDWGEANEAMAGAIGCCMCHGRKTESYTETSEVPCPVCKGK